MSKPGIMGTIQLAATLVFALPIGLFGVQMLLDGKAIMGAGFVTIGVLMVVLEEYLTTPTDIPSSIAEKAVGKAVKTPEEDKE